MQSSFLIDFEHLTGLLVQFELRQVSTRVRKQNVTSGIIIGFMLAVFCKCASMFTGMVEWRRLCAHSESPCVASTSSEIWPYTSSWLDSRSASVLSLPKHKFWPRPPLFMQCSLFIRGITSQFEFRSLSVAWKHIDEYQLSLSFLRNQLVRRLRPRFWSRVPPYWSGWLAALLQRARTVPTASFLQYCAPWSGWPLSLPNPLWAPCIARYLSLLWKEAYLALR